MMPHRRVFLTTLVSVAAVSFAAGRLLPKREVATPVLPGAPEAQRHTPESLPPSDLGIQIADIAALPFDQTYASFKSTSPETLRSYCKQLQDIPVRPKRQAALAAFFKALIHVDPGLAKDLILQLNKADRWTALFAIRDTAPPRSMQAVAEVLLTYDRADISSCSWDMLADTLDEWGHSDPLALKQFLENRGDQDVERYYGELVRNWAAYDPEAAQEWMNDLIARRPPSPELENGGSELFEEHAWRSSVEEMLTAWVRGFLEHDADAAMQYVLVNVATPQVSNALVSFAGELFAMSPDRARDFIHRLPEEQRPRAIDGVAEKANAFVRSNARDNSTSPRFVAEWMLQFPADVWEGSISNVLHQWKAADAGELLSWMGDLTAETREAVVRRFPTYVLRETAERDFASIMQARDAGLRDVLLEKLMRGASDAREAMIDVLGRSVLPAAEQARLAAMIPMPSEVMNVAVDDGSE